MTGLIKSDAGGIHSRVRPFALVRPELVSPAPDPELTFLRERCLALEAGVSERDVVIEALTEKAESAYRDGAAAGREMGRAEADDRRDEALTLLRETADRACTEFAERLQGTDALAALLARTCLDRMFGDPGARADIVCDLIRHRIDVLGDETVVELRVSAEDFERDVEEDIAGRRVTVSNLLSSGDCTIQLALGTIEAGLDQQWGTLGAALTAMAGEGAA